MPDLAKTVLTIDDPRKCKALVANIKTTEQWQNEEKVEMAQIVTAKYQVPEFRKKMIETGNRRFVECTRDKKMGCGRYTTI